MSQEQKKEEKQQQENISLGIYDIENPEPNQSTTTSEDTETDSFFLNSDVDKRSHLFKMMILQQEVLNKRIGTQAWKKYLSAAFWNYITTPINFSITLLTAIATGQAATANILTPQQTLIILFVTFVLTTTNSFFKLNTKMNLNFEAARRYYSFGTKFEEIYYKPLFTNKCVDNKLKSYNTLHDNINKYMLSETIENQNYITEILYNFVMRTSYVTKSKWINEKERHYELDGVQNKEHDSHSIANRISSLVSSALGKNATEIDAMTNEKIDDIKRLYDNDKKKQVEEIKLLKEANKKMLEDIQKLKTEKTTPPSPVNPTNNQMVLVDKKETTEKSVKIEKKNEVKKEEEEKKELDDTEIAKYNEIRDYFKKVQTYILKDKKDDDKIRTFLKGELSEILGILEEIDSDENSSSLKYEQVYKYFIKLTDIITDEYIKTNFKEIKFTLDPTNNGNIPINMRELFVISFERFCYPLIEKIQKEEKEEDKIEVD
jgi:hypothetical protein|uniref:SMODS and SLOG-associating 2TM effector domain-containing protein n=1 Tax=viral metagenome TaxID=1070528 RepID=A0A6C0CUX1_9ZZZZ